MILGGIVTSVRTGFTKNGKPYGIVTLEDFEGSGELALFGEDWGDRSGFFTIGASVYVTGKIKPRFSYNADGPKDLKITGVEFLQTVKDKAIDRITISLSAELLNEQIVMELSELIAENPGNTSLFGIIWMTEHLFNAVYKDFPFFRFMNSGQHFDQC